MKKSSVFLVFIFFICSAMAVSADSWDDFADLDRMWDGQKAITNKDFEQVMGALEQNTKKKEEKQRKKKIKKVSGGGTSLHSGLNPDNSELREIPTLKPNEEGILINVPVRLNLGSDVLEKGYYKLFADRDEDNKIFIKFYQSQFFKGKIEAVETEDDYGEAEVDFARILPYNASFVKIIFGSLDFNAYAYIPCVEE